MNKSEQRFHNICVSKNWNISKSSENQDIHEHWDFKVRDSLIDVKGLKRTARSDKNFNQEEIWVELQNVRGRKGWLRGKADYIAFEHEDYFLIVNRQELLDWCKKKIKISSFVSNPRQALYRLYQRKNRKDIISIIKTEDFKKDIRTWKLR
mgnify:CR=1 FL=1